MDPSGARLSEKDAYDELQGYALGLGDERFVHQHVVDAWMAQHADERTRPISLTFALVGGDLRDVARDKISRDDFR